MSGIMPESHQVVNGATSATDTAVHTLIAAPSSGRLAITGLQLGRSDAGNTAITVTLNDISGTQLVVDNAGNGRSLSFVFDSPLMFSALTAMTFKCSSGVTTALAAAQGFVLG
ncbi:MAG: hypothetical protein C5B58_07400 [Acidobacteria bacterium]|nr:MAG: hypothetical protein C5B58_07400 [Acidobacteriota bacterium]